jgi:ParB family chromosome partitioning protein
MEEVKILGAKDRNTEMIPIDKIVVVNSRDRDKKQFEDNVRSIREVGLYKPILVNRRRLEKTGKYELVCGQGRLMAHQQLGNKEIGAYVWDLSDTTAQIMTIGENLTRTPPEAVEYARAIKQMRDDGMSFDQLSAITGKSEPYIRDYIQLVENGEERLIKGVETGIFPLSFATSVAGSTERSVQHLLMDAFDSGIINTSNLSRVRRVIEDRLAKGKSLASQKQEPGKYTVVKLVSDIRRITREKEGFVRQAGHKENRLFQLLAALRRLQEDEAFAAALEAEGLAKEPELKGKYEL